MPVKSLADLCRAVAVQHVKEIFDVGSTPYALVREVLMRIDSAQQLQAIEEASPHIAEEDAELWRRLIERDFALLSRRLRLEPKNPASWHRVYHRYAKINIEEKRAADEKVRAAFAKLKQDKEQNVATVVNFDRRTFGRPPPERGTVSAGRAPSTSRRGGGSNGGELRFTAGSRTKTNTAQSVMRRVKREAKEIANRNKISTPTHILGANRSQVTKAPPGLLQKHRRDALPMIRPPSAPSAVAKSAARDSEILEREKKLMKIKSGANYLSDDEFDESDQDSKDVNTGGKLSVDFLENEDLFDDEEDEDEDKDEEEEYRQEFKPAPRHPGSTKQSSRSGLFDNVRNGMSKRTEVRSSVSETRQEKAKPNSTSGTSMSPRHEATSPPAKKAYAGSPELVKPMRMPPPKRKAPDIFMKPKAKVMRR